MNAEPRVRLTHMISDLWATFCNRRFAFEFVYVMFTGMRWVTSIAHFRWKGTSLTNHCWIAEN